MGGYLAGVWGVILGVPLGVTIIEVYKYLKKEAGTVDNVTKPVNHQAKEIAD